MTKEEAKEYIYDCLDHSEATEVIKALEQAPITWIVGKDNCQVAVRNMPIDKMKKNMCDYRGGRATALRGYA